MPVGDAIRRHGFRRWYERQLVESHAYLVTGFLSLIMMAVAVEASEVRKSAAGLLALVTIAIAGGWICLFTWGRFNRLLFRAEHLAERATCGACGTYGRFAVVRARDAPDAVAGCSLDVRCRRCGHEWTID